MRVGAFLGRLRGFKLAPAKRRCLVPSTRGNACRYAHKKKHMKQSILTFLILSLSACSGAINSASVSDSEILVGAMRVGFLFNSSQVYLLNTDGSGESVQKPSWTSMDKPIWSPDGHWVAFDKRYSHDDGSSIYIARADGSQSQRVSYHEESDYHPSWSPDGTHIVYGSYNTEHSEYHEDGIYTLDVTCILNGTPCDFSPIYIGNGHSPAWSPDGKQIAFGTECVKAYHYCIHTISADGTGVSVQLSPSHLSCYFPQWSPTGTEIIFDCYNQSCCSPEQAGIYKVKSDGTDFEMIVNIPTASFPQWSPDGSKIAFISSHDDDLGDMIGWEAGSTDAIYIVNADGTGITRLGLRSDEDVYWFTWLPNFSQK